MKGYSITLVEAIRLQQDVGVDALPRSRGNISRFDEVQARLKIPGSVLFLLAMVFPFRYNRARYVALFFHVFAVGCSCGGVVLGGG